MGDCPANYNSVSENIGGFCEPSNETPGCAFATTEYLPVNDLSHHFTNYLNIRDGQDSNDKCISKMMKKDASKDSQGSDSDNVAIGKCLTKCATFPCSDTSMPPSEFCKGREDYVTAEVLANGADAESPDLLCSRSISLLMPLKLVSALKGGREKQGRLQRELTVTWAPDVYDPIPTAVSHAPNKGPCHKNGKKKNGKNKRNNGKSSRGSKGKDKKQARKHGGSSEISYHPLGESNITASSSEVESSIVEFDIGSPDSFCGSSFLRESITELHFSVAEAT